MLRGVRAYCSTGPVVSLAFVLLQEQEQGRYLFMLPGGPLQRLLFPKAKPKTILGAFPIGNCQTLLNPLISGELPAEEAGMASMSPTGMINYAHGCVRASWRHLLHVFKCVRVLKRNTKI